MSIKIFLQTADLAFGNAITTYLSSYGCDIAENPDEVQIVIYSTDLTEPSAYARCQSLRRMKTNVKIIILSNEISLGEDVKARYAGASHVFTVPFSPKALSEYILQVKTHGKY